MAFALGPCSMAVAQSHPAAADSAIIVVQSSGIVWREAGPGLTLAIVEGDPSMAGRSFTMMLRLENGAWIPPHWHNQEKRLYVLQGELLMGDGPVLDSTKVLRLGAGGMAVMPARHVHYEGGRGLTVVALTSVGPFQSNFLGKDQR